MGKLVAGLPSVVDYTGRDWYNMLSLYRGKCGTKGIFTNFFCTTLYEIWRVRNARKLQMVGIGIDS